MNLSGAASAALRGETGLLRHCQVHLLRAGLAAASSSIATGVAAEAGEYAGTDQGTKKRVAATGGAGG